MLIEFLSQSGPRAPKHSLSWLHPITAFTLHYLSITIIIVLVHDLLFAVEEMKMINNDVGNNNVDGQIQAQTQSKQQEQLQIATFTIMYFCILILYRIILNKENKVVQKGILYESTWLCNSTLYMATLGLLSQRYILVLSHVVVVSIDQVLWYVDLTGWVLSGFKKFPIGVAKYLTWPETSWATRITCTHHLWTIPLLIYACGGISYPMKTFILSAFVMVLNVSMSRWLTPSVLEVRNRTDDDKHEVVKYLNVNLSHEVWKDITFDALQIKHDDPPVRLYLLRLFVRWQALNGIIFFVVVYPLSTLYFPQ